MDRPFLSSYKDRHGKARWRFRRGKVTKSLPGVPGDARFEEAYAAALEGRTQAQIIRHPNHALPRTLKAAWRLAASATNMEWQQLGPTSRDAYVERAERLLAMEIAPGLTYADVPIADLKRRHVKALIGSMSDRPHAAYDALVVLRKMIMVALDQEWIEVDPTHMLKYHPAHDGHRAWTDAERERYEARWPLGTLARTAYACGLYTGSRRGDVARLKWTDLAGGRFSLVQEKTGNRLVLPILPELREALDGAPRTGPFVLGTQSGAARSADTLTNNFIKWTAAAGLKGCTLHGLRKTLGKIMAESGATTRELMDALGHSAIAHAELYSREADQEAMAKSAFQKVGGRLRPRLRVVGGEPPGRTTGSPARKRLK